MSFVRPSFSHIFLNRRSICSADSVPRALTLIMQTPIFLFSLLPFCRCCWQSREARDAKRRYTRATRSAKSSRAEECNQTGHFFKLPRGFATMTTPPYPQQPMQPQAPVTHVFVNAQPTNGLGLAGFITSLVGIVTCGVIAPIGLVLSLFGLMKPPRGFAIAGTIIGLIGS